MVEYLDGWWRLRPGDLFTRDHPEWKRKHPLGPVSFDFRCPECSYAIEDASLKDEDRIWEKIIAHWFVLHELPRLFVKSGGVLGYGDGI